MTNFQEKLAQLCFALCGLFNRRERLILEGKHQNASYLDPHIDETIHQIRLWLAKHEEDEK